MPTGLIIGAPHSDAGKTTATLSLLRALRARARVAAFKCGPDYIDPRFHTAASGEVCYNLDPWSMSDASLAEIIGYHQGFDLCLCEGVMGLFDGAADNRGSTAELACRTGWPVVLVVDCKGLSDSIAPLVQGFCSFDPRIEIAGVVLNRVGSDRHAQQLRRALEPLGVVVFGSLPRSPALNLPKRHLGLLQAQELPGLEKTLDEAADMVSRHIDLRALQRAARPSSLAPDHNHRPWVPQLGARVAIADDPAFAFCYPHWRRRWADAGVELMPFSPLADEPPCQSATGIFLPGGYPELHAETLAAAEPFRDHVRRAARAGTPIYGECGGFMVLGRALIDAAAVSHPMCGMLDTETSFASRQLQLGYRHVRGELPPLLAAESLAAHEFHYSVQQGSVARGDRIAITNAVGEPVPVSLHTRGSVVGSYLHMVDRLPD